MNHAIPWQWLFPSLVLVCALTVRLIVLFQFREQNPLFTHPVVDAWKYDMLAREYLRQGVWPEPGAFFQPPAYPYFLALVYFVFGKSYTWARIIQASLGSLSCLVVYFLGTDLYSRKTGLAAGLICAVYGPLIYFDLNLLAPVLIVFWSVLGLWLLTLAMRRDRKILLAGAGLCLGMALITWPIVGLACAGIALLIGWSLRRSPGRAVMMMSAFSLGVITPVLPVYLHNVIQGEPALVSTNGGINFYIGNNPRWKETVAMRPGYPWEKIVTMPYHTYGPEAVEKTGSSALFFREAGQYITDHPLNSCRNLLLKLDQVLFGYEIMRNTDLYFFKQYSPLLDRLISSGKWLKFPFGLLLPFSVVGIFFSLRENKPENRYLLAYIAAGCLGLILFFVTARYRVILVPVLALYAVSGFRETVGMLRRGKPGAAMYLVLLAGIAICANLDLFNQQAIFTSPIYRAQAPFTLGRVNLDEGRPQKAISWLKQSVAIDPSYPDAWVDLGRARYALGDTAGAVAAMQKAAAAAPDYPLPWYNLGRIYDHPDFPPALAIRYYRLFLTKAGQYYDALIRGPQREQFVRNRLAVLTSRTHSPKGR